MLKNNYHYLVAGLPDLTFEDQKQKIGITEFCHALKQQLYTADYAQVKIALLIYDIKNLVRFLEDPSQDLSEDGNFSSADFQEQISNLSAILPVENILPDYMVNLISYHYKNESGYNSVEYEKKLAEGYYQYVMDTGIPFLRAITDFDYNMKNLLSTVMSTEHNCYNKEILVGNNEFVKFLKKSAGKNLTSNSEFEFLGEILTCSNSNLYSEAERKYDQLRWNFIEDKLVFESFSIEYILGYLMKLQIIERWTPLAPDKGEQILRMMMTGLKEQSKTQLENLLEH